MMGLVPVTCCKEVPWCVTTIRDFVCALKLLKTKPQIKYKFFVSLNQ